MFLSEEKIVGWCEEQRKASSRIILTNGCFDLLHVGHKRYLEEAKALGGSLLVGVNSDSSVKALKGDTRPINGELERAELLLGLRSVDAACLFAQSDACALISLVCPDLYVKGGDYDLALLPEREVLEGLSVEVVFLGFSVGYSSSSILARL